MIDPEYYVGAVRGGDGAWSTTKYCDEAVDARVTEHDMKACCPLLLREDETLGQDVPVADCVPAFDHIVSRVWKRTVWN